MSTQRGRITIDGFHSGDPEEDSIAEWTDERRPETPSRWRKFFIQLQHDRLALVGFFCILGMVAIAIFARPLHLPSTIPVVGGFPIQPIELIPHDPTRTRLSDGPYAAPSSEFWLGTDNAGRDMFSRTLYGTRFSITMGLIVTFIAASFGVIYGGISGYFGGRVDDLLMRIVDLIFAFPGLVLALVIVAMLGRGYWQLILAFTIVGWAGYARLIRGEILKVRQYEYVLAAKALGAKDRSVIMRHVVPNAIAPVVVQATLSIGTVVIGIAALGFLGVGFTAGTPEWGTMLNDEYGTIIEGARFIWWTSVPPGIMIFIFVMAMNMLGDAINDALDAKSGAGVNNMGGG